MWRAIAAFSLVCILALPCSGDVTIYSDSIASGWDNWSWSTSVANSNAPVSSGTASLSVDYTSAWAGLYFHSSTVLNGTQFTHVRFRMHGGQTSQLGGRSIALCVYDASLGEFSRTTLPAATAGWTEHNISLSTLGNPSTISGLVWQDASGAPENQNVYYLDEIVLVSGYTPPPPPQVGPSTTVNASMDRHAISPDIYGMNFCSESLAQELALPVRRNGGNSTTRYNYLHDTSNRAMDWFFENIPEDNPNPSLLPTGSSADRFVEQDRRTGTKTIITVPLIGWTPKSRDYAGGFSITKYGAQQQVDPWRPDFGNGIRTNGTTITGNDPTDTSIAIGPDFVTGWINHLKSRFGTAGAGGVAFYNLDNEPMLWNSTHRDVHPTPTSYDEIRDRTVQYAAAIKAADPSAKTLGPVLWGWTAYFYSALDAAPGGNWWNNPLDRNAHGGTPFVEWYLQQMCAYEQAHGTRILDYLDLHFYPQCGVALTGAGSIPLQELRLRSTRCLWDPTYVDESWIAEPVRLIPRMRDWVNTYYPGTKIALTEYNWGALDHINGAVAQADILGIFGRESVDLATLWDPPNADDPGAFAFRMFRNYDGTGKKFGETCVRAISTNQAQLAAFAAQRTSDNALTVMLINKTNTDLVSTTTVTGFSTGSAVQVYRYSPADLSAIRHLQNASLTDSMIVMNYPAQSITLLVVSPAARIANWREY